MVDLQGNMKTLMVNGALLMVNSEWSIVDSEQDRNG
jgi:hypothetical protein